MAEVATAAYDIEPAHGDLPGTRLYKACIRKLLSPEGVYSGDAHVCIAFQPNIILVPVPLATRLLIMSAVLTLGLWEG